MDEPVRTPASLGHSTSPPFFSYLTSVFLPSRRLLSYEHDQVFSLLLTSIVEEIWTILAPNLLPSSSCS